MCLLLGPSSVGKTLMLKRFQSGYKDNTIGDDIPATIPTVGTNLVTIITQKKTEVTIRELGGAMGPIWNDYYKDSGSIMYMIDISKQFQVSISFVLLMNILSHPDTQSLPILIILNKKDVQNGMNRSELDSIMRLDDVLRHASQKITVVETSAKVGLNLNKVVKWIHQNHRKPEPSEPS